jgi:hypothetical protein
LKKKFRSGKSKPLILFFTRFIADYPLTRIPSFFAGGRRCSVEGRRAPGVYQRKEGSSLYELHTWFEMFAYFGRNDTFTGYVLYRWRGNFAGGQ